jgi:hypothetical protein
MRLTAAVLLFTAVLAGCGDGGGLPSPATPAPPAGPPAPPPPPLSFGSFPDAAVVVGQPTFDAVAPDGSPDTLSDPRGAPAITPDGRLFVSDLGAGALTVFNDYDAGNARSIALQIPAALPASAASREGKLVFIDGDQVKIYNTAPSGSNPVPDSTAGNSTLCNAAGLSVPGSAYLTPGGRLLVADSAHHRVLVWNQVRPGALGEADIVLGQNSMTTCAANDYEGDDTPDANPTASTMKGPNSVWSDDKLLVVADTGNNRLLVWDTFPTTSFQPAKAVIGQRNPTEAAPNLGGSTPTSGSLSRPVSLDVSEAGQLAVVDQLNHRVLVWNAVPTTDAKAADQVLGQPDFGAGQSLNDPTAKTLSEPDGIRFHKRNMVVVDQGNRRVLVWRSVN